MGLSAGVHVRDSGNQHRQWYRLWMALRDGMELGSLGLWFLLVLTFSLPHQLPIPKPKGRNLFDDSEYFEVPDTFEAGMSPMETFVIPEAKPAVREPQKAEMRRPSAKAFEDVILVDGVIDL